MSRTGDRVIRDMNERAEAMTPSEIVKQRVDEAMAKIKAIEAPEFGHPREYVEQVFEAMGEELLPIFGFGFAEGATAFAGLLLCAARGVEPSHLGPLSAPHWEQAQEIAQLIRDLPRPMTVRGHQAPASAGEVE